MLGIAAGILTACAEPPSATSVSDDNHADTLSFESITPKSTGDFLAHGGAAGKAVIKGELSLPAHAAQAVPAVVILHGSSGVNPGEHVWARRMNALGYAAFIVDSFTGRGIRNTEADQTQLSMTADIADAYAALRLLAADPRIDGKKIAVMGFSRGGVAALYSSLEPFRQAAAAGTLRFAAHVAFYPSCGIPYTSAHLDGSPILMLLGGKDNYTPAAPCVAYADELRAHGGQVAVRVYPDAYHGFDRPTPLRVVGRATSARECQGEHDLDSGKFTMTHAGRTLSGAEAVAESKRCLTHGVTLGGDAQGQAQSPAEVERFLESAFEKARG